MEANIELTYKGPHLHGKRLVLMRLLYMESFPRIQLGKTHVVLLKLIPRKLPVQSSAPKMNELNKA